MANARRLQRLLELRDKDWKRRLAQGVRLERELGDIAAYERDLMRLLDQESPTSSLFAELTLERLRHTASRKRDIEDALNKTLAEARAVGQGVKMLEQLVGRLTKKSAQDSAAAELKATIELALHPSRVRLP